MATLVTHADEDSEADVDSSSGSTFAGRRTSSVDRQPPGPPPGPAPARNSVVEELVAPVHVAPAPDSPPPARRASAEDAAKPASDAPAASAAAPAASGKRATRGLSFLNNLQAQLKRPSMLSLDSMNDVNASPRPAGRKGDASESDLEESTDAVAQLSFGDIDVSPRASPGTARRPVTAPADDRSPDQGKARKRRQTVSDRLLFATNDDFMELLAEEEQTVAAEEQTGPEQPAADGALPAVEAADAAVAADAKGSAGGHPSAALPEASSEPDTSSGVDMSVLQSPLRPTSARLSAILEEAHRSGDASTVNKSVEDVASSPALMALSVPVAGTSSSHTAHSSAPSADSAQLLGAHASAEDIPAASVPASPLESSTLRAPARLLPKLEIPSASSMPDRTMSGTSEPAIRRGMSTEQSPEDSSEPTAAPAPAAAAAAAGAVLLAEPGQAASPAPLSASSASSRGSFEAKHHHSVATAPAGSRHARAKSAVRFASMSDDDDEDDSCSVVSRTSQHAHLEGRRQAPTLEVPTPTGRFSSQTPGGAKSPHMPTSSRSRRASLATLRGVKTPSTPFVQAFFNKQQSAMTPGRRGSNASQASSYAYQDSVSSGRPASSPAGSLGARGSLSQPGRGSTGSVSDSRNSISYAVGTAADSSTAPSTGTPQPSSSDASSTGSSTGTRPSLSSSESEPSKAGFEPDSVSEHSAAAAQLHAQHSSSSQSLHASQSAGSLRSTGAESSVSHSAQSLEPRVLDVPGPVPGDAESAHRRASLESLSTRSTTTMSSIHESSRGQLSVAGSQQPSLSVPSSSSARSVRRGSSSAELATPDVPTPARPAAVLSIAHPAYVSPVLATQRSPPALQLSTCVTTIASMQCSPEPAARSAHWSGMQEITVTAGQHVSTEIHAASPPQRTPAQARPSSRYYELYSPPNLALSPAMMASAHSPASRAHSLATPSPNALHPSNVPRPPRQSSSNVFGDSPLPTVDSAGTRRGSRRPSSRVSSMEPGKPPRAGPLGSGSRLSSFRGAQSISSLCTVPGSAGVPLWFRVVQAAAQHGGAAPAHNSLTAYAQDMALAPDAEQLDKACALAARRVHADTLYTATLPIALEVAVWTVMSQRGPDARMELLSGAFFYMRTVHAQAGTDADAIADAAQRAHDLASHLANRAPSICHALMAAVMDWAVSRRFAVWSAGDAACAEASKVLRSACEAMAPTITVLWSTARTALKAASLPTRATACLTSLLLARTLNEVALALLKQRSMRPLATLLIAASHGAAAAGLLADRHKEECSDSRLHAVLASHLPEQVLDMQPQRLDSVPSHEAVTLKTWYAAWQALWPQSDTEELPPAEDHSDAASCRSSASGSSLCSTSSLLQRDSAASLLLGGGPLRYRGGWQPDSSPQISPSPPRRQRALGHKPSPRAVAATVQPTGSAASLPALPPAPPVLGGSPLLQSWLDQDGFCVLLPVQPMAVALNNLAAIMHWCVHKGSELVRVSDVSRMLHHSAACDIVEGSVAGHAQILLDWASPLAAQEGELFSSMRELLQSTVDRATAGVAGTKATLQRIEQPG